MNKKIVFFATLIILATILAIYSNKKPQIIPMEPVNVETANVNLTKSTVKEDITKAIATKYKKQTSAVIVNITVDTGSYAKGTVNFAGEMGGGLWFAAKTKKGWELAFDGNGIISCEIVNKYNFPVDIIPGCVAGDKFVKR